MDNAEPSRIRVVFLGITGRPKDWQPVVQAASSVCQPMIFPFSPDDTDRDRRICGNVVEYADTAVDLKGEVIDGTPTIVFLLPGLDSIRRLFLLCDVLPRTLTHHEVHTALVYFEEDLGDPLLTGILKARMRGVDTYQWTSGDVSDPTSFRSWWTNWLVEKDPQHEGAAESGALEDEPEN